MQIQNASREYKYRILIQNTNTARKYRRQIQNANTEYKCRIQKKKTDIQMTGSRPHSQDKKFCLIHTHINSQCLNYTLFTHSKWVSASASPYHSVLNQASSSLWWLILSINNLFIICLFYFPIQTMKKQPLPIDGVNKWSSCCLQHKLPTWSS